MARSYDPGRRLLPDSAARSSRSGSVSVQQLLRISPLASPSTSDTFDALYPVEASRVQQEILDLFRAAEAEGMVRSDELFAALYAELHRLAGRVETTGGGNRT